MFASSGSYRRTLTISLALASPPAAFLMPARASAARGETRLMSRASGPGGAGGTDASNRARISGDGRFVAFESNADNLSADDNDAFQNVFVRDAQTGTTTLVSRAEAISALASRPSLR